MYVVDASVWVSRFVPTDPFHRTSRLWLSRQIKLGEIVAAPALVLAEVAGAVARQTGRPDLARQAVSLMQRLPNNRLVRVDSELARLGAEVAAAFRLRGADVLYVALAQRLVIPLITWDREQKERGENAVPVLTPQEVLGQSRTDSPF